MAKFLENLSYSNMNSQDFLFKNCTDIFYQIILFNFKPTSYLKQTNKQNLKMPNLFVVIVMEEQMILSFK